jgi:hypothetical protein
MMGMHGFLEGLDNHDCPTCLDIAKDTGADPSKGKTNLYKKDPRETFPPGAKNDH